MYETIQGNFKKYKTSMGIIQQQLLKFGGKPVDRKKENWPQGATSKGLLLVAEGAQAASTDITKAAVGYGPAGLIRNSEPLSLVEGRDPVSRNAQF